MKDNFQKFSIKISSWSGSTWAFALALLVIIDWGIAGKWFHYSDTWMLIITTVTDVIIFLMVFSIQNTQTRDSKAIQLKLNELIIATKQARDMFVGLENFTDSELAQL